MPLTETRKKLSNLMSFDIIKEVSDIINANSEYISNLLAIQLAQGKDAKNENVTLFGKDYYSDWTVFNKEHKGVGLGKVTDRVTNYMSGAFYHNLHTKVTGQQWEINSDVPYFSDILLRSGRVIMELSQEHLDTFSKDILIPQLKERLKFYINGI